MISMLMMKSLDDGEFQQQFYLTESGNEVIFSS